MKENITQMRKRHGLEIDELQYNCKHKVSSRMAYAWAPGHFGADVEVCSWCGKTLKTYNDGKTVWNSGI